MENRAKVRKTMENFSRCRLVSDPWFGLEVHVSSLVPLEFLNHVGWNGTAVGRSPTAPSFNDIRFQDAGRNYLPGVEVALPLQNIRWVFRQVPAPPSVPVAPLFSTGLTGAGNEVDVMPVVVHQRSCWANYCGEWLRVYNVDRQGGLRIAGYPSNRLGEVMPVTLPESSWILGFAPPLAPLVVSDDPRIGKFPERPHHELAYFVDRVPPIDETRMDRGGSDEAILWGTLPTTISGVGVAIHETAGARSLGERARDASSGGGYVGDID